MSRLKRSAGDKRELLRRWYMARLGIRPRYLADRLFLSELRAEGENVGLSTLFWWSARYRLRGIIGMVDRRGSLPLDRSGDDFLQEVRRLRELSPRPSIRRCHRLACDRAKAAGWPTRSYGITQRYLTLIRLGGKKRPFGLPEKGVRAAFKGH